MAEETTLFSLIGTAGIWKNNFPGRAENMTWIIQSRMGGDAGLWQSWQLWSNNSQPHSLEL